MFRKIRWRIFIPHMILILLSMVGLTIYISEQVRQSRMADLEGQLLAEARLMADGARSLFAAGADAAAFDDLARRWAAMLEARVTMIGEDGTVLGESHEDRTQMDNHLSRPEVQQAKALGQGRSIRFSRTVNYELLSVAVRVGSAEKPLGYVRVSLSLEQVESHVAQLRWTILVATLATTLLSLLLSLLIAERTARPVRDLTQMARRILAGDLRARLFPSTRDEVGQLTVAFGQMTDHMQREMAALVRERGRLATVLEHMADGVLITDSAGQVLLVNPAAARLLDTGEQEVIGRTFAQVVRNHQLIELWKQCQESGEERRGLLELSRRGLFLQAIVTSLPTGDSPGYLVILQDLTRLRHLETVRQDFVSNVSHELRTPLVSLKALVDALRGGAMDDPPTVQRFLNGFEVEVDTLTQIVEELLELSRIESGKVPLRLRPVTAAEVVVSPVERLRPQAERAGLTLALEVPSDLAPVQADLERVQQVVTNLVHNAIKFTPSGGQVTVSAVEAEGEAVFSVRDTGVGIPADDLPRIFERFYKADRARSGGGTGLGLAISKHIVQGHGGRIWATSIEGRGSTFYFSLPAAGKR